MPSRIPDLSQGAPTGKGMAYKGVATVMDGHLPGPLGAERPACPLEPEAQGVPRERLAAAVGQHRADEEVGT